MNTQAAILSSDVSDILESNADDMFHEIDALEELVAEEEATKDVDAAQDAIAEIEKEEAVQAAYDDAEADTGAEAEQVDESIAEAADLIADENDAEAEEAGAEEAEAEPAAKKKRTSTLGMKPSEAIVAKLGESVYETMIMNAGDANLSEQALRSLIDERIGAVDLLPKKVGEKVINVFHHIQNGGTLSCYTKQAIELLKKEGEMGIKDIRNRYLDHPYSLGTASAQSSQMMKLLPFLGIAEREGQMLTLKKDSVLVSMLCCED